jgi:ferredoxin-type protein NapF
MAGKDETSLGRRGLFLGRSVVSTPAERPIALISEECLAYRRIACMICRDPCPTGAVRFSLTLRGAVPQIDSEACTGCAECVSSCPSSAIALTAPAFGGAAGV